MNGSINHSHYNVDKQTKDIQQLVAANKLAGPMFVGQGLSRSYGSDCYGYYIVASKKVGAKTIWGIAAANSVMHEHWTEGTLDCSIDIDAAQPQQWIVARGTWRRFGRDTGITKWWFCDENGKRSAGDVAGFCWNGAYAYRDPSF